MFCQHLILLIILIMYAHCAPYSRQGKLSIADWDNYNEHEPDGPGTYAFGYDIEDPETDNVQFRNEERLANGTVTGSYGYLQPDGNIHIVNYIADHLGYRATVETRPRGGTLKPVDVLTDENNIPDSLAIENMLSKNYFNNQEHNKRRRPNKKQRRRRPFNQQNNYEYIQNKYSNKNNLEIDNYNKQNHAINNNLEQGQVLSVPEYKQFPQLRENDEGLFYDFYYIPTKDYR